MESEEGDFSGIYARQPADTPSSALPRRRGSCRSCASPHVTSRKRKEKVKLIVRPSRRVMR